MVNFSLTIDKKVFINKQAGVYMVIFLVWEPVLDDVKRSFNAFVLTPFFSSTEEIVISVITCIGTIAMLVISIADLYNKYVRFPPNFSCSKPECKS